MYETMSIALGCIAYFLVFRNMFSIEVAARASRRFALYSTPSREPMQADSCVGWPRSIEVQLVQLACLKYVDHFKPFLIICHISLMNLCHAPRCLRTHNTWQAHLLAQQRATVLFFPASGFRMIQPVVCALYHASFWRNKTSLFGAICFKCQESESR